MKTISDADRISLQRACVAEHMSAENAHDWPAVYRTFVQDDRANYDVVPLSTQFPGLKGVIDFYEAFVSAIPDLSLIVTAAYDTPGCSIREVTLSGTHQGEFAGVRPTGQKVTFELAAFYLFGDNASKLVAERVYFDMETVLRQMRGEANVPTGLGLAQRKA